MKRLRDSTWFVPGLVLAYFAAQILRRVLVSHNVQLDESEQLLWSQELNWGYGSHPPLYTWLLVGFFQVFGTSIFTLALLKNLLLCSTCLFVYATVKELTGARVEAAAAMSSLVLVPQLAWESQRDQSHSVLATAAAAATLWVFLRVCRERRWWDYALLGFCVAVGILGKYSYGLFAASLLIGALTMPRFRAVVFARGMCLALGVAVLCVLPHVLWAHGHPQMVLEEAEKIHSKAPVNYWLNEATGVWSLVAATVEFSGLAALVYAIFFWRRQRRASGAALDLTGTRTLLGRTMLIGLGFCLAMVLAYGTHFKDRWLQQILFATPIYLLLWVRSWVGERDWRPLLWFNATAAVGVFMALAVSGRLKLGAGTLDDTNHPYASLAARMKERGFDEGVIFADGRKLAGNLKVRFPQSKVIDLETPWLKLPPNQPWVGVWLPEPERSAEVPPALHKLIARYVPESAKNGRPLPLISVNAPGDAFTTNQFAYFLLPPSL